MNNFNFHSPTRIVFGKGALDQMKKYIGPLGKKVLLVYGKGSIKRTGVYDKICSQLSDHEIWELSDVMPNPRVDKVKEGADLCRKHGIDVIVAAGGGSVFDCSKAIAAACFYDGDPWDLVVGKAKVSQALPIACVVTMSATGSEMNDTAVISNWDLHQKIGLHDDHICPTVSFLDPENLFTVPSSQMAAGIADILSHLFEQYFTDVEDAYVQDGLAVGCMKACIHYGPIVLKDPSNYEACSNLMWAAPMALNGLLKTGYSMGWSCHPMEHVLSAYYDVTHGEGLAILTPRWMRYILDESTISRFKKYGIEVWGIDANLDDFEIARQSIQKTEEFLFETLQLPRSLSQLGILEESLPEMAKSCVETKGGSVQGYKTLYEKDVLAIYKACL